MQVQAIPTPNQSARLAVTIRRALPTSLFRRAPMHSVRGINK